MPPTGTGRFKPGFVLEEATRTNHPRTGEEVLVWDPPARSVTVYGELVPLSSRELVRAKQVQDDTTHRLRIRYRTDVVPTWRVRWSDPRGSHIAQITGVTEPVLRRELELQLVEVAAGGG